MVIALVWMVSLRLHGTYDERLFGYGPAEYRAVIAATLRLFVTLAVLSYLLKLEIARGYLLIVLPAGLIGLVLGRWTGDAGWESSASVGRFSESMVVVGDRSHLTSLVAALKDVPSAGYRDRRRLLLRR